MKSSMKLLCILLVLCMALSLGACKKKNAGAAATLPPAAVTTDLPADSAVIYYLSGAKYLEVVYSLDQLDIADPANYFVYFEPTGFGVMNLQGVEGFETYFEYADGQLWDEMYPDNKISYTIAGDTLTLEQEGVTFVFTQGQLPEWAQPTEPETENPDDYVDIPAVPEEETTPATEAPTETTAPAATEAATQAPETTAPAATEATQAPAA